MSKSIAGYQIYNRPGDYEYMLRALRYFTLPVPPAKLSRFLKTDPVVSSKGCDEAIAALIKKQGQLTRIIAYCIMPTHFHLLVQQLMDNGLSSWLRKTLNAYTRFFNTKYERRGPLWMGRFKNILIENDEQLRHVTRYIHLNPTTAALVRKPEDWAYSSYPDYIFSSNSKKTVVDFEGLVDVRGYKQFCEDEIDYQRELGLIKHLALD